METTTKSKLAGKTGKTSGTGNELRKKSNPSGHTRPTEDQIREKAKEIYHERLKRGEYGTAIDDWNTAEKMLKGS
jgi:hypothetical protein